MSLPKWISENIQFKGQTKLELQLIKALEISWGALETIHKNPNNRAIVAFNAIRDIEKLEESK